MKKCIILLILSVAVCSTFAVHAATPHGAEKAAHWSYTGSEGPNHWGDLSDAYIACKNGLKQSPVDIAKPVESSLKAIKFKYKATPVSVLNNGHTIQLNYEKGSSMSVNGKTYDLLQLHFHSPSENIVNGKHYPMEMHLVHKSPESGELAVIAVFLKSGNSRKALKTIWNNMPKQVGKTNHGQAQINALRLLPGKRNYDDYSGSLTTPPCTEGVHWFVMQKAIGVTKKQVAKFVSIIGKNARPVQALHERKILYKK